MNRPRGGRGGGWVARPSRPELIEAIGLSLFKLLMLHGGQHLHGTLWATAPDILICSTLKATAWIEPDRRTWALQIPSK